MIRIRRSQERGFADHGWLKSYHTFSFADYHDEDHMGFRDLRVINEDWVEAGQGFGTHPHRDMEIITFVLEGELAHKDSMENGSVIRPGEVQYMSAGSGVRHSEFNHSPNQRVHLFQIWILPNVKGAPPRYDQKRFETSQRQNRFLLAASPDGADGSIAIRQDARLYLSQLAPGKSIQFELAPSRFAWLHVAKGEARVNGELLQSGDAMAFSQEKQIQIESLSNPSELLLFDLV